MNVNTPAGHESEVNDVDDSNFNAYVNLERSIIVHQSANQAQQTPMHVSRIRRPSRYNESPFTMKFDSADVNVFNEIWLYFEEYFFHFEVA
ncbi:hypothetical protein P3S67_032324 [Capsicum chacoense]